MSQRFFCNRQIEESNRAISQWNNTLYHKRLLRFSDQGYIVRQNVYGSGHSLGHLNRALEPDGTSRAGHGLPCVGCDAYRLCAAPQHGSGILRRFQRDYNSTLLGERPKYQISASAGTMLGA